MRPLDENATGYSYTSPIWRSSTKELNRCDERRPQPPSPAERKNRATGPWLHQQNTEGRRIEEMRELVRLWTDAPLAENKAEVIRMNPLNKATRARVVDVLNRIFVPRFIEGSIRELEAAPTVGGSEGFLRCDPPYLLLADRPS